MELITLTALLVNTSCAAMNLFFYATQKSKINLGLAFLNIGFVLIILGSRGV